MAETDAPDTYAGPRCQGCGGPCWLWKGDVWQYTCTACLDRYLDDGAARWAARERREQEKHRAKIARNMLRDNDNPTTSLTANTDRRQEGGGSEPCAAPSSGVDRTKTGGGSAICSAPPDLITREDTDT
ncbi:hypothetical protein QXM59_05400 [Mycobacterium sp. TY813]|nr:hypothetical protein [Mycobacterium sp. TY813]MDP7727627.1 hypothetical protein [Mycobacterium sp. TY813]